MSDLFASVDLGGTNIHAALADAGGHVVAEEKVPTDSHEGPPRVLARIAALVNELAARVTPEPEIGHQTLLPDGPLCGCGDRVCLEALASGSAIIAEGGYGSQIPFQLRDSGNLRHRAMMRAHVGVRQTRATSA